MATVLSSRFMSESKKTTAVVLTGLLALAGLTAMPTSASATTAANPTIVFDGNTLASSVPATETATRISADSLRLSTSSLSRTVSTTRSGYTFGGWSLARGDAAATEITTPTTGDTTRTLFAVWNTTINYGTNFADSGTLPSNQISAPYRFGQTLTLPTAGTLVKAGYAFGGWMNATVSTSRFTSYTAASFDVGNPTVYVAWIKTVTFNANGATVGSVPGSQTFVAGGTRLDLPTISAMTLRRPGYDFIGWSTTATGSPVSGPTSYVPLVAQQTLYAIWKIQSTKTSERVFFNPGKSTLRAAQKLIVRDLVDTLRGKTNITLTLVSNRAKSSSKSLGKARNAAVVAYLRSLGVTATIVRENNVSSTNLSTSKKVNRVTIQAGWTNPN
jgi:uncharacterized repeat protein (TIGR02543 family)